MMEIYNDNLRDLLSAFSSSSSSSSSSASAALVSGGSSSTTAAKRKLKDVRKLTTSSGQLVAGLVAVHVSSLDDIRRLTEEGRKDRA